MKLLWMVPLQELIDDVPLYVNVKEVCRADGSVEALELNYLCVLGLLPVTLLCELHTSGFRTTKQLAPAKNGRRAPQLSHC